MGLRFWPVASGIDDPDYGEFPLKAFLGLEIEDGEPGQAEAWLDVGDDHMNPNGVVHGGVVFTLADTAMGRATMSILDEGQFCASIEVSVRFLRAVPAGRLRARVQVLHAGRRIVHLDGRVFVDGEEKPVAAVSGSFAVLGG